MNPQDLILCPLCAGRMLPKPGKTCCFKCAHKDSRRGRKRKEARRVAIFGPGSKYSGPLKKGQRAPRHFPA